MRRVVADSPPKPGAPFGGAELKSKLFLARSQWGLLDTLLWITTRRAEVAAGVTKDRGQWDAGAVHDVVAFAREDPRSVEAEPLEKLRLHLVLGEVESLGEFRRDFQSPSRKIDADHWQHLEFRVDRADNEIYVSPQPGAPNHVFARSKLWFLRDSVIRSFPASPRVELVAVQTAVESGGLPEAVAVPVGSLRPSEADAIYGGWTDRSRWPRDDHRLRE